jgi:hypothetical protein
MSDLEIRSDELGGAPHLVLFELVGDAGEAGGAGWSGSLTWKSTDWTSSGAQVCPRGSKGPVLTANARGYQPPVRLGFVPA